MRTRHQLKLFLLQDFPILLSFKTTHSEGVQEIVREKSWQKRQVVSFPFLPGRIAGGPGKGRRIFMARGLRDLANLLIRGKKSLAEE
uniref:Uncharacterized protein n=1 Tax=Ursus maritimus TaxID=29073 RepID=A0A452U976_URSMA